MVAQLYSKKPEPVVQEALERCLAGKDTHKARVTVRIIRCSVGSLDPDNLTGSVKWIIDGLRAAGLIEDDTAAQINLDVSQLQVATRKAQGTYIEIIYENTEII